MSAEFTWVLLDALFFGGMLVVAGIVGLVLLAKIARKR